MHRQKTETGNAVPERKGPGRAVAGDHPRRPEEVAGPDRRVGRAGVARRGPGEGGERIEFRGSPADALPARQRDLVRLYARMGAKDPARAAACEGWLKNHLKMQLPAFAAGLAQFASENAKLAEALGEQKAYLNENTGPRARSGCRRTSRLRSSA